MTAIQNTKSSHQENQDKITVQTMKHTEIGVIPEDWEVSKLDNLGFFSKGKGISKSEANSGEIPAVRYGELYTKHHNIITQFHSFISANVAKSSVKLQQGDILFAGSGETKEDIGKSVAYINDFEVYAGGDIVIFSPRKSINSKYLGYLLNHGKVQKQKSASAQGDAVVHIYANNLKAIQIPLPPLPEQEAIAEALSDADAWIDSLEKLIAKKRLIKQGGMQELLTPKEDWEVKKLGEHIRFQTGFPFSSKFFNTKNIGARLVKNRDLRSDDSLVFYDGIYKNEFVVNDGDLLIGMDGDFEPVLWKRGAALLNQRVGRVLRIKEISIPYLAYSLIEKLKDVEESTGSTTVKHLSHGDIENLVYKIPPLTEQTRVATILSDMDAELEAIEKQLGKARQIKQGMMQELLTGRIRLL